MWCQLTLFITPTQIPGRNLPKTLSHPGRSDKVINSSFPFSFWLLSTALLSWRFWSLRLVCRRSCCLSEVTFCFVERECAKLAFLDMICSSQCNRLLTVMLIMTYFSFFTSNEVLVLLSRTVSLGVCFGKPFCWCLLDACKPLICVFAESFMCCLQEQSCLLVCVLFNWMWTFLEDIRLKVYLPGVIYKTNTVRMDLFICYIVLWCFCASFICCQLNHRNITASYKI